MQHRALHALHQVTTSRRLIKLKGQDVCCRVNNRRRTDLFREWRNKTMLNHLDHLSTVFSSNSAANETRLVLTSWRAYVHSKQERRKEKVGMEQKAQRFFTSWNNFRQRQLFQFWRQKTIVLPRIVRLWYRYSSERVCLRQVACRQEREAEKRDSLQRYQIFTEWRNEARSTHFLEEMRKRKALCAFLDCRIDAKLAEVKLMRWREDKLMEMARRVLGGWRTFVEDEKRQRIEQLLVKLREDEEERLMMEHLVRRREEEQKKEEERRQQLEKRRKEEELDRKRRAEEAIKIALEREESERKRLAFRESYFQTMSDRMIGKTPLARVEAEIAENKTERKRKAGSEDESGSAGEGMERRSTERTRKVRFSPTLREESDSQHENVVPHTLLPDWLEGDEKKHFTTSPSTNQSGRHQNASDPIVNSLSTPLRLTPAESLSEGPEDDHPPSSLLLHSSPHSSVNPVSSDLSTTYRQSSIQTGQSDPFETDLDIPPSNHPPSSLTPNTSPSQVRQISALPFASSQFSPAHSSIRSLSNLKRRMEHNTDENQENSSLGHEAENVNKSRLSFHRRHRHISTASSQTSQSHPLASPSTISPSSAPLPTPAIQLTSQPHTQHFLPSALLGRSPSTPESDGNRDLSTMFPRTTPIVLQPSERLRQADIAIHLSYQPNASFIYHPTSQGYEINPPSVILSPNMQPQGQSLHGVSAVSNQVSLSQRGGEIDAGIVASPVLNFVPHNSQIYVQIPVKPKPQPTSLNSLLPTPKQVAPSRPDNSNNDPNGTDSIDGDDMSSSSDGDWEILNSQHNDGNDSDHESEKRREARKERERARQRRRKRERRHRKRLTKQGNLSIISDCSEQTPLTEGFHYESLGMALRTPILDAPSTTGIGTRVPLESVTLVSETEDLSVRRPVTPDTVSNLQITSDSATPQADVHPPILFSHTKPNVDPKQPPPLQAPAQLPIPSPIDLPLQLKTSISNTTPPSKTVPLEATHEQADSGGLIYKRRNPKPTNRAISVSLSEHTDQLALSDFVHTAAPFVPSKARPTTVTKQTPSNTLSNPSAPSVNVTGWIGSDPKPQSHPKVIHFVPSAKPLVHQDPNFHLLPPSDQRIQEIDGRDSVENHIKAQDYILPHNRATTPVSTSSFSQSSSSNPSQTTAQNLTISSSPTNHHFSPPFPKQSVFNNTHSPPTKQRSPITPSGSLPHRVTTQPSFGFRGALGVPLPRVPNRLHGFSGVVSEDSVGDVKDSMELSTRTDDTYSFSISIDAGLRSAFDPTIASVGMSPFGEYSEKDGSPFQGLFSTPTMSAQTVISEPQSFLHSRPFPRISEDGTLSHPYASLDSIEASPSVTSTAVDAWFGVNGSNGTSYYSSDLMPFTDQSGPSLSGSDFETNTTSIPSFLSGLDLDWEERESQEKESVDKSTTQVGRLSDSSLQHRPNFVDLAFTNSDTP
ncbi:hypothetical protein BLNAU_6756 [Blattamonas nauphoetae]|uniref:Sfi1 spindle body domain-containing protein n=1 Tax=Blattamonas nauphoetae TaxID=2049346 RepID=A0ABQ9Y3L7_9EUKA|nr:hypothetical protein BLNAU_6756 [Blattamonas nauphoetae]